MKHLGSLFFIFILLVSSINAKDVAIIGTGYVGLILGSGLAQMGHNVICSDIDEYKIHSLRSGKMPIYEPGLEDIVVKNMQEERLYFTVDVPKAVRDSEIVIVAVGTPMKEDGSADLRALKAVVKTISQNLNGYKVICIKSTVPIGTNRWVKQFLNQYVKDDTLFDIVSNPEFLRAGVALRDFFEIDPIVLGSDSDHALDIMVDLYKPLFSHGIELIRTDFATAEMIKYGWNCFSATKLAYANELSRLCKACEADVSTVILGAGYSDKILPLSVIKPGPGYGGSCLPKDTRAFVKIANKFGVDLKVIDAVIKSNQVQRVLPIQMLYDLLGDEVEGKTIGILGLSFKPNTDDIRESSAIPVIEKLLLDGVCIKAYDPKAMENMKRIFPHIQYCDTPWEAVTDVDAVILLTQWREFKNMDLETIVASMSCSKKFACNKKRATAPMLVDGRNMFDPADLQAHGFVFANLGRR